MNWEKGHTKPEMQNWPAIIAYLGYDPFSDRKRPVTAACVSG